jgi:hypothetical protein
MQTQAPFLDVRSFVSEQGSEREVHESVISLVSPFLSVYEAEEGGSPVESTAGEYAAFLNEFYDEEFDEALLQLASEAAALYDTQFVHESENGRPITYEAERIVASHFAPLAREAEAMMQAVAAEFGRRDPSSLTQSEIDTIVDRYRPSAGLSPSFENFFGKLKKAVKKVASKAVDLAKKGISAVAKLGLGPILEKLKPLIQPLLKRVLQIAIGKLPSQLQPIAKKLAERLPFLKEIEEAYAPNGANATGYDFSEIQNEFNQQVANLLFAPSEIEQELELARAQTESRTPVTDSVAELDDAREHFVEAISKLREGEDPTPHIENFIPAILPALRIGIQLVGRKRVVDFLAKLLGKLIQKFVGPQYAPALSQAIVDAGLRLIQLESTPEDEARAASSAVAATIEETVRRVAALPEYVLENHELLEGFALEAFEQAAAANLPAVLPEESYRKRPDLLEAKGVRGTWFPMPLRSRRKRYKKFSRILRAKLTPHKVAAVETFGGVPLAEFLEEQLGIPAGADVEADVHLYEGTSVTLLPELTRLEQGTQGLGSQEAHTQLHPLTREAAGVLLGEPGLGREVDSRYLASPHATAVGQRYYFLEIPGQRPLATPEPGGPPSIRRRTNVKLALDFPANEIRIHIYLSEVRAQELATKLRQQAHLGAIVARLQRILQGGLGRALNGGYGRLKLVHEAVVPNQWREAFQRLPSHLRQVLLARLQEWTLKGLSEYFRQHAQEVIAATEEPADGITLTVAINNPPGFAQLRQAIKGKVASLASLKMSDGAPTVKFRVAAGSPA